MSAEANSPAAAGSSQENFYTRKSSGLVREISLGSAIALNISYIALVYAVFSATQIAFAFPGASSVVVVLVCAVFCLATYLLAGFFTQIMPRSGGDYVFVGRTLHPWAGLFTNVNLTLWLFVATAFLAYTVPQFALPGVFASVGTIAGSSTLLEWSSSVVEDGWTLAIGGAMLILFFLAASVRVSLTLKLIRILFALSLIGVLVAVAVMLLNDRGDFRAAVASFGGDYDQVIRDAAQAGYAGGGVTLKDTLLATPIAFLALGFGTATAYVAGELRSARKIAIPSMLAALAIGATAMVVCFGLASSVIGRTFLGSATFLSFEGSADYPFSAPAEFFFFIEMLAGSTIVAVVLSVAYIASVLAVAITGFIVGSRNIFAWSFDRLVPTKLSDIGERSGAPIAANSVILAISALFLVLMIYGPADLITIPSTLLLGEMFTFIGLALAGIFLPYRRPDLYAAAPIRRSHVAGLPTMTLVSFAALLVYGFFAIVLATNDSLAANSSSGITALIVIAGIALIAYPVAYLVNKSRGLDVSLATRELPPE